jgi:hypothetical protein
MVRRALEVPTGLNEQNLSFTKLLLTIFISFILAIFGHN